MDPPKSTPSQHLRVLNGFSVIDIQASILNETFYEVSNAYDDGKPKQVYPLYSKLCRRFYVSFMTYRY